MRLFLFLFFTLLKSEESTFSKVEGEEVSALTFLHRVYLPKAYLAVESGIFLPCKYWLSYRSQSSKNL